MRIGIFTDTYSPDINGVVTSIVTLKNALEREGHKVFIITNHPSLSSTSYEDRILRLPGVELKFLYGYTMSSPLHISAVEIIEEMELDIIHVHTEFGIGIFARSVAKQLQIPMVITYHTQYEDYTHYFNVLKLKGIETISKKLVASVSRLYSKNVQVIIAPSEKTKHMLMRYDIRKEIAVIPTGIDLQRFKTKNEAKIEEIRNKYKTKGKFVLTYIGRIAEEKSLDIGIDGFAHYYKDNKDAHMMIVGGGPALEPLKEKVNSMGISDGVTFVGPVPSEDVPSYYHASDAFVSASLTETQGLTYIEALACELCVFARFDKPLEYIILEDKTGFLFDTPEEMAQKMAHYVSLSNEEKETMRKNALDVVQSFDSKTFGLKILEIYQKAVDTFHGKYILQQIMQEEEMIILKLTQQDYSEYFAYDKEVLDSKELELGMEMSRNEITELENAQKVHEAMQLSLKRLALRDYSSHELTEYLHSKMVLSQSQVNEVLDNLKKRHFIDDKRFLLDKVYYYQEQLRGNDWIVENLMERGFAEQEIRTELEKEDPDDYIQRALKRGNRFMETLKDGSRLQRFSKYKQHMTRHGFESDVIRVVQDQLTDAYESVQEKDSLEKVLRKSLTRYRKRYDEYEAKTRAIKHASSKGYPYQMIKEVMEEINDDNED